MARSITTIQNQIITNVQGNTTLYDPGATDPNRFHPNPSATAIWILWTYIVAVAINIFEQLLDIATLNFETIANGVIVGNALWWVVQMKAFQYSSDPTNPQAVSLVDFVPTYPVINSAMKIITQVAVVPSENRTIILKTAKGLPGSLTPLTASELMAAQSYVNIIQPVGNNVQVVSLNPDRLKLTATIYYNGQYVSANVKAAVITAITAYLAGISNQNFNGYVDILQMENAIQIVPGVADIVITEARARDSGTSITSGGTVVFTRNYQTYAGYIIPEDTENYTLATTITMQPA